MKERNNEKSAVCRGKYYSKAERQTAISANIFSQPSRDIKVHKDKVAYTPRHDEQMKDFMRTKALVPGIEQGEL